jgi:hypothetical protein
MMSAVTTDPTAAAATSGAARRRNDVSGVDDDDMARPRFEGTPTGWPVRLRFNAYSCTHRFSVDGHSSTARKMFGAQN